MASNPYLIFAISIIALYVCATITKRLQSSKYKLPPLVPGVPIFGNSFQIPPSQQGRWGKKLAETYGEM